MQEAITIAEQINKLSNAFSKEEIAEEIADCMVMLNQFKEYYKITDEQINKIVEHKVGRQIMRMAQEDIEQHIPRID